MEKIYGYKMKDVTMLAEYLKSRGNSSLTSVFIDYAKKHGKAKGTVRNLYYALAKRSVEDEEFCQKYLDGKPLEVSKIVEFNEREEKELIKEILLKKAQGKSVRSTIMQMADGDGKVALRYQNKYRNAIKNKPELIEALMQELKGQGLDVSQLSLDKSSKENQDNSNLIDQLKKEIDGLVMKIAQKIRKENIFLKERVSALEKENLRLLKIIYGQPDFSLLPQNSIAGGRHDTIS